jgi:hypothetical protein
MKAFRNLSGTVAAALLFVGIGAGSTAAQTATPNTGAATCTDTNFHQYTKYHGLICYSNLGSDNLDSSGFWTYAFLSPCYTGWIFYDSEDGAQGIARPFSPSSSVMTFWLDSPRTGLVSVTQIDVDKISC